MARKATPLTDVAIRNAKPAEKTRKLFDGGGLYVEITPSGGKLWRFKYQFASKAKLLALGQWPETSLSAARRKREEARELLARGIDPGEARKAEKLRQKSLAENTFEAIAKEWDRRHLSTRAKTHRDKVMRRLEVYVFPYLGHRPVSELTAPEILACVRRIEAANKLETAHRTLQAIGQVIRYAVANGLAESDPTPALRGALPPVSHRHMAAPTDPARVGEILRALDAFQGSPVVAAAIKLLPLVFCRPGELIAMRWADVDLEAGEWRYTVTKTKTEHLVPLSRQALAILRELEPLTRHLPGGWVFPGGRSPMQHLSNMAINAAYRRLGIDTKEELTPHGWRAVARTLLHERLGYPAEAIEHQLAHRVPDALGKAYNRTRFLGTRLKMMQAWADYLDRLRDGADVIQFPKRALKEA
jgi:integrase